jgi:hypothetical protein
MNVSISSRMLETPKKNREREKDREIQLLLLYKNIHTRKHISNDIVMPSFFLLMNTQSTKREGCVLCYKE